MLSSLKIENVAVIEYSEIVFDSGLNILTGETGAGKSIIIDSINAILGERTSRELIRDGADRAKVTAYFENVSDKVFEKLKEFEIDCEDNDDILITRIITSDGRNSCKINGHSVTAAMLRLIGRDLISICGQHDSQYLLSKEHHIDFIDAMADCDELKTDYLETFEEIKSVRRSLKKLISDENEKERKLEFLKYQIDELSSAELKIGEKEKLIEEKKKILNREKILRTLNAASSLINGDEDFSGISDRLNNLFQCLQELSVYDRKYSNYIEAIENAKYIIDDCSAEISSDCSIDSDDYHTDIDAVEERLDLLYRLSKKYGEDEEAMLAYLDRIRSEYNEIVSSDELIESLSEKYEALEEELFNRGCYLSDARKETAIAFEKKVIDELKYLDIPDARFTVEFGEAKATEKGIDEVEFLFSANAGQELKPLAKIASGGELSRVMLAIRCVLSDSDSVSTMIFDEIDTGVSGRAASKIANKMHQLSKNKQVMCVTHLAQIAAYADNHLFIEKVTLDDKTYTKVTALPESARVKEIARIIGGAIITQTTLDSAKELVDYAKKDCSNYS